MVNDTLQNTTRALHDVGLAAWLGGAMFGKFALNPSVAAISDKSERGKVANLAWNGYNAVHALGLGAAGVGYFAARGTELHGGRLTDTEQSLYKVQDVLTVLALVTGVANFVQGGRLAKQAPGGAVPIQDGTTPSPQTPPQAAKLQRSIGTLGNANLVAGAGLLIMNALLDRIAFTDPPKRRFFTRSRI